MHRTNIKAIGLDVGSTTTKAVAINENLEMVWFVTEPTNPLIEAQAQQLLEKVVSTYPGAQDAPIGATGYGRKLVSRASHLATEIKCHARGIFKAMGHGGTLIDIGGQDSKVITVGPEGAVLGFVMNDKCAAGTGRFLENTASRLRIPIEKIGELALGASGEVPISSTCVVFAESEIVSMLAHGTPVDHILAGVHSSLVQRVAALARTASPRPPMMLSGGVARNPAIPKLLSRVFATPITLPEHPQLMGALGAALVAAEA